MLKKYQSIIILFLLIVLASCKNNKFDPNLYPVSLKDKWGYVDKSGKYVIIPQFSYADYFIDGLALVADENEKFGYINEKGDWVIQATYENASNFSEDLAAVVPENNCIQYINKKGKVVFEIPDAKYAGNFHEGLAKFKKDDKWGFIDKKGKIKIEAQFDAVMDFTDGRAAVFNGLRDVHSKKIVGGTWGFIDNTGKLVIDYTYKDVAPFNESLALVSSDGIKYGFINKQGKKIIPEIYIEGTSFCNGIAAIKVEKLYGFINNEGKVIINPQYDEVIIPEVNKLIAVKKNNKWGYINEEGTMKITPQFVVATNFIGEIAMVIDSSEKVGLIDGDGKFVATPQFDKVSNKPGYIIYGIGYTFKSVESELNIPPEKIAYKYIYHLFKKHYVEARKLATEKGKETVSFVEQENKKYNQQDEVAELSMTDVKCKVHKDSATYSYNRDGKLHNLRLVKKGKLWLVDIDKNEYVMDNAAISVTLGFGN
jgi:hypothetical protein